MLAAFAILSFVIGLLIMFWIGKAVLSLPLKREEGRRLFLDVLELSLKDGRRPEEAFLSMADAGERSLPALRAPVTPRVMGVWHLVLGLGMSLVAVVELVDLSSREMAGGALFDYGVMMAVATVLGPLTFWAGVQLMRYRRSGRKLAVGLAVFDLVLLGGLGAAIVMTGMYFELLSLLPAMVMPIVTLLCLTHPLTVAACGTEGKQDPEFERHLRDGKDLLEALRLSPGVVEPRLLALLEVGRELGDLRRVLPAARAAMAGATGEVRKAQNYMMVLLLVVMPMTLVMLPFMMIFIFPKFEAVVEDMTGGQNPELLFIWISQNISWGAWVHGALLVALWLGVANFLGGTRLRLLFSKWCPVLQGRWELLLPWKRKRLARDFSQLLATLLDAGLREARSVTLAAKGTGNAILCRRAEEVCAALENGTALPEALRVMDGSGEFHWRLQTAARAGQGFLPALRAWHEALDARAFQQEQAASQLISTSLVIYNGAIVALIMGSVFQFLLLIMEGVSQW